MDDQSLYHGLTRDKLDFEYNNRERVPQHAEIYAGWAPDCAAIVNDFETRLDVAYGDHPREKLDIFIPEGDGPFPIRVFIHGGYWMSRDKEDSRFVARGLVEAGAIVVSVEYALIPDVDMAELVRQCRAATAWTCNNAADFKGDADRVYVSGHSAGGHVAAMLLATDWTEWGLPADAIKGAAALSGIYDLTPMRQCYIDDVLHLGEDDVRDFSPIHLTPPDGLNLILAVGMAETDEFIAQTQEFAEAWARPGKSVTLIDIPEANHFTILNHYADRDAQLCRAMAAQMGLG